MSGASPMGGAAGHDRGHTLVVATTFPQYADDPRGGFILRHWERAARAGQRVRVLAPRNVWGRDDLVTPLQVRRVVYAPRRLSSLAGNFGILENIREQPWRAALVPALCGALWWAIDREVARDRPRRIVAHMLLPGGWAAAAVAVRRRVPLHLYGHGTDVDLLLRLPAIVRRRFGRLAAHADGIFVPSAEKRDRFVAAMPDLRPDAVGVRTMTEAVPVATGTRTIPDGPRRVLYLGRLTRQKGVDDLLSAAALLRPVPGVDVAGDGPERRRLQRLAHRLGVPARFHGFVGETGKAHLLRRAEVVCVPSRERRGFSEGAPLVIREAFAYGIPVVATRVGGIPELCRDGGHATLVPADRPRDLGEALAGVLGAPYTLR